MKAPSPLGSRRWAIAEVYIPSESLDSCDPALVSHETACLLNPGDENAETEITVFFEDREPAGPYKLNLPARRTKQASSIQEGGTTARCACWT